MRRHFNIISRCVKSVQKNNTRLLNYATVRNLLGSLKRKKEEESPYDCLTRVGDPILRQKTIPVDLHMVRTEEFQKVLDALHRSMIKNDVMALSAPQIGLPWQLFAVEITENDLRLTGPYWRKLNMEVFPLTYFINPVLKVTNPEKIMHQEMCGSVPKCGADVPRAKEIEVEAYDRYGEPFTWKAKDWSARVIQHEYDHLQGNLYIDIMLPHTFKFFE